MDTEFEVKYYPINKEELREKLEELGAKLTKKERKMRRAIADIMAYPQLKCHYIRVRDEGGFVRLSAKRHTGEEGRVSDTREIEFEVADFDKAVEFLAVAGLKPNRYQETLREEWELGETQITIDTWPGLEPLVEIEGSSTQKVKETSDKLGFDWDKKIITATPEIYSKVYNLSMEEVLKRMSNLTFEENPFADLKES